MLHLIVDCVLGGLFATLAAKLFADESDVSSSVESSAAMAAMCMGVDFAAIPMFESAVMWHCSILMRFSKFECPKPF